MRIVYIDLHCVNFLLRPFAAIYNNNKIATYKHKFLIDYALANNIEICNYITGQNTSLCGIFKFYKYFCKLIKSKKSNIFESNLVIKKNFGNSHKIKMLTDATEIRKDDIVVCYLYSHYQLDVIKTLPGKKICFLNHFISVNEKMDFDYYGIDAIVNEVDLSENEFFLKNFKYDNAKIIICPYTYESRFQNYHRKRSDKALIIGTLSTCKNNSGYKLYREFFQTEWIQTLRKLFYDNRNKISDFADSYISYINEDIENADSKNSNFHKIIIKIKKRFVRNRQSKYTSFNMVDKFNEYSMFLCPEENADMPGIGCFEGMASGTAYIGLDEFYYRNLGFIPGENYISYDGTIEGLKEKVNYYRKNSEKRDAIAQRGYNFVRDKFNATKVAAKFFEDLSGI